MPNLDDLLRQSMLFTAARGMNATPVLMTSAFRTPKPKPQSARDLGGDLDPDTVMRNPIWRLSWDPAKPGTFTNVQIYSRGMGMDYGMPALVYKHMEFRSVQVVRTGGQVVDLYLDPEHMIGAWRTTQGKITGSSSGLWPLDINADVSMLVAFGFNLDGDKPSGFTPEEIEELGDELMPPGDLPPRQLDFITGLNTRAWVCVGPARYIVMVELVLCKENNEFVPGGFIGFARIHPHVLIWSNEDTVRVGATIVMQRPANAMAHGDAMHDKHKVLLVADTNVIHDPSAKIQMPLPTTDRLYDYYEVEPYTRFRSRKPKAEDHPLQKTGEVTLADARFKRGRINEAAIKRHSPLVMADPDVVKEPRQGQFDNVHIAPRMKLVMYLPNGENVTVDDLPMLNTCLHDCTHMHVRWSAFLTDHKPLLGWRGNTPHVEPGAPQVPENQTVFASFPNDHGLEYRAIAERNPAGHLTIFCHHGLAYAVDQWPDTMFNKGPSAGLALMRGALEQLANEFEEPYWNGTPNDIWALFYFRVRYTGKFRFLQQRSIFNVEDCMR